MAREFTNLPPVRAAHTFQHNAKRKLDKKSLCNLKVNLCD